jgi:hypothetical protein
MQTCTCCCFCCYAAYAPAAAQPAGATRHRAAPARKHPQQQQQQQQQHPCTLLCWARQQLGASNDWSGLRPSHAAFAPAAAPLAGAMRHGAVLHATPASKLQQQQHHRPCSLLCWARRQLGEQNDWYELRPIHSFKLRHNEVLPAAPASKQPQKQQQSGERNDWGGLRPVVDDNWNRTDARRPTQGSAYANWEGPDSEDEPGPPFSAYSTESTSVGPPGGTYYHEGVLCCCDKLSVGRGVLQQYHIDTEPMHVFNSCYVLRLLVHLQHKRVMHCIPAD